MAWKFSAILSNWISIFFYARQPLPIYQFMFSTPVYAFTRLLYHEQDATKTNFMRTIGLNSVFFLLISGCSKVKEPKQPNWLPIASGNNFGLNLNLRHWVHSPSKITVKPRSPSKWAPQCIFCLYACQLASLLFV